MNRILTLLILAACALGVSAQTSVPAPGSGGSFQPSGGFGGPAGPPPVWAGPSWSGPAWGGPWTSGYSYSPSIIVNTPIVINDSDSGVTKVIACGYDAQGVWRTIPLTVSYNYNGANYDVRVPNAWNPWTDCWNRGVDQPAYSTSYFLNGTTFDYYTNLSTGTYYFNL